jgi:hypothetical protein
MKVQGYEIFVIFLLSFVLFAIPALLYSHPVFLACGLGLGIGIIFLLEITRTPICKVCDYPLDEHFKCSKCGHSAEGRKD